ncbi:Hint domain-containing protein [Ruegeria sp.]|uniref:Hint domain-containing protein n=1 Tax=Ruegeria sp. TaxID=1879320 RepID=UPI003C7C792A
MAEITIYEVDEDPLNSRRSEVLEAFQVEILDDDDLLEVIDQNGTLQLDVSGIPGFIGDSTTFNTYEKFTGRVDGEQVSFILLQYQGRFFIVVTEGEIDVDDIIRGIEFLPDDEEPVEYDTLPDFVCFTHGSLIKTPMGLREIETLRPGDLVTVADGSDRPVRWIGRRRLSRRDLNANPKLMPVCIEKGAFGDGLPKRDLSVSPQHRFPIGAVEMVVYYHFDMMLAPAKALVNGKTITQRMPSEGVEYIHLLFDQHELVNVEGVWSESFFPGGTSLDAMSRATQDELFALFPSLKNNSGTHQKTILPVLKPYEVKLLIPGLCVPDGARRIDAEFFIPWH